MLKSKKYLLLNVYEVIIKIVKIGYKNTNSKIWFMAKRIVIVILLIVKP